MFDDDRGKVLFYVLLAFFWIAGTAYWLAACADCADRGVVFVDSPWPECVEARKP